jgi:hypothetical protein
MSLKPNAADHTIESPMATAALIAGDAVVSAAAKDSAVAIGVA